MATTDITRVIHHLRSTVLPDGAGHSDAQLLHRFVAHRDEAAFAALVGRHGPMVWAVCLRVLGNHADAEDAFQATFLVLAKKAASIASRDLLAGWLHGVAHNTALKSKAMAARRHARERQVRHMPEPQGASDELWDELQPLLDQELSHLPEDYRAVLVLCDLEGKSRREAALQLGCPEGTVAGRVVRARALLARRLARRGLAVSAPMLAAVLPQNASASVPASVLSATLQAVSLYSLGQAAASGVISAQAVALTHTVVNPMLQARLRRATLAVVMLTFLGVGLWAGSLHLPQAHDSSPSAKADAAQASRDAAPSSQGHIEFAGQPINLLNPTDDVYGLAISPDGTQLAVGFGNWARPGRLEMWDFRARKRLWSEEQTRGVSSVVFSPDSKRITWSSWGGQVRIDQLSTRRPLFRLPTDGNFRVACSLDGKWLALAGENGSLRLLDAGTGRLAATLTGDFTAYFCVAFSNDSKLLAAGGGSYGQGGAGFGLNQVNLFDVATRKQVGKLTGHTRVVANVAFSRGDELIATASADTTLRIHDGKTFQFKTQLRGHTSGIKGLAFSPDGKTLASGSWDRTVRLWEPVKGTQVAQLDGHPAEVREVAFSPDGNHLVSSGARSSVKLWDVKQRKLLATLSEETPADRAPAAHPLTMAATPDGKLVATGRETGEVNLRDARSGALRRTIAAHDDAVTALAFSPDGKVLASGGPDMVVKLWEVSTGKLLQALKGHKSWVYALAFSRDGRRLASGGYDRTVRVWDAEKGQPLGTLGGHKASVRALAFSPAGTLLASGGADQKVRLWDLRTLKSKAALTGHDGTVRAVAFAPDGRLLASAGEDGQLRLWDTVKEKQAMTGKPMTGLGELLTLAWSPSGGMVIVGNQAGNLAAVDAATGVLRRSWFGHGNGVLALALAQDGQRLFTLGGDGGLKLWEGEPGPLRFLDGHTGPVRIATFSPDGKYLLSCSGWPQGDRTLRLWDVKTGKQVRLLLTGSEQVPAAAFSPDGKYAAAGENNGVIHLFEVGTGKAVREFRGHKAEIPGLTFSGDGKWLLSAGSDRTVRLWDVPTGDEVRLFRGHTDWARCAVFHPDGKRILSGGRDNVVRVWDRHTGQLLKTIDHDKKRVERLVLLPDGRRFLSCTGGDGPMRLWDLETGNLIRSFGGHSTTTWLATTKDGRRAFTTGYDGAVRLHDVETGVELNRFAGHRNWIWCVEVAPDGKTFVTAGGGSRQGGKYVPGDDFTIRLWKMPE
jgi:RNA polymerase sigma factor (sigma-70 family)